MNSSWEETQRTATCQEKIRCVATHLPRQRGCGQIAHGPRHQTPTPASSRRRRPRPEGVTLKRLNAMQRCAGRRGLQGDDGAQREGARPIRVVGGAENSPTGIAALRRPSIPAAWNGNMPRIALISTYVEEGTGRQWRQYIQARAAQASRPSCHCGGVIRWGHSGLTTADGVVDGGRI